MRGRPEWEKDDRETPEEVAQRLLDDASAIEADMIAHAADFAGPDDETMRNALEWAIKFARHQIAKAVRADPRDKGSQFVMRDAKLALVLARDCVEARIGEDG